MPGPTKSHWTVMAFSHYRSELGVSGESRGGRLCSHNQVAGPAIPALGLWSHELPCAILYWTLDTSKGCEPEAETPPRRGGERPQQGDGGIRGISLTQVRCRGARPLTGRTELENVAGRQFQGQEDAEKPCTVMTPSRGMQSKPLPGKGSRASQGPW